MRSEEYIAEPTYNISDCTRANAPTNVETLSCPGEKLMSTTIVTQPSHPPKPERKHPRPLSESDNLNAPLRKIARVSRLPEVAYDIHANRFLANEKGIAHRETSLVNIPANSICSDRCGLGESMTTKYIMHGLNSDRNDSHIQIKDLENGADTKSRVEVAGDSIRTGARKYIACIIARGKHYPGSTICPTLRFPELTGPALQHYIKAYGMETYESYIKTLNSRSPWKVRPPEMRGVEHRPHHDMESVIWVLFDTLARALPKGAEEVALTRLAINVIRCFDTHVVALASDTRRSIPGFDEEDWGGVLHPSLSFLAGSLSELGAFLEPDWSLWKDELPRDFMHEALKRNLLREIIHLRSSQHLDVPLMVEQRAASRM